MKPVRAPERTLHADLAGSRSFRSKRGGTRRGHVMVFVATWAAEPFRVLKGICAPSLRARRKMKERKMSVIISSTRAEVRDPVLETKLSHAVRNEQLLSSFIENASCKAFQYLEPRGLRFKRLAKGDSAPNVLVCLRFLVSNTVSSSTPSFTARSFNPP
jgi:hypothetical protein